MDIYEIAGYSSGIDNAGVNFLDPADACRTIENGFIYRQEFLSRQGFKQFANRLGNQGGDVADNTRVMGIFEHTLPDSTKQLLVCTKEFLYKYNTGTNIFEQIPNNSAAPFTSFGITSNEDYVSGTSYPTATNTPRFVFTGRGMSDIYFYDGVEVKRFTNLVDNPNYQAPAAGALSKATYVAWFGERLNFFVPVIAAIQQSQMVLYSGIRNVAGNGDKFNVAGSGNISADTYEYMTGATIAGDYMVLNFNRSTWTLEKTRDAFNPYFIRKIPGVLGTDASFSAVSWAGRTESIGKTGIIATDGKQALRTDNKIPYFTADNIDQIEFDLTYGGFDRITAQYLFAYKNALSDSDEAIQDKVLVNNYEESTWAIFDMRFSVFGQTNEGKNLVWNDIDETQDPAWGRMDTTEEVWNKIGIEAGVQKTLAGDDKSFVYELNADYDDYFVNITNITQASQAVVTVDPCALEVGDIVHFTNVSGMTEINDLTATILSITETLDATTSITVNIDSENFTAYSADGNVSKVISFYAEFAPFNPYRAIGRKCFISHIEFLINTNNGNLMVDIFDDEETSPFIGDVLLQPQGTRKARDWVMLTVNHEANFMTIAMKQQTPLAQVVVSSIRIHCMPGGLTSA